MTMQPVQVRLYDAVSLPLPGWNAPSDRRRMLALRAEAQRRLDAGEPAWSCIDGPNEELRPVMEIFTYGHWADQCTAGVAQRRGERVAGTSDLFAPCGPTLEGEDYYKSFERRPGERRAGLHRDWRRPSRRQVRNATRAAAKLADTYFDADELESGMYTR